MDKHKTSTILLYSLLHTIAIISLAQAEDIAYNRPEAVEEWFENLPQAKQKSTKLHFYFHDVVVGKNQTSVTVAQANYSASSPNNLVVVNVMDDLLTEGPDANSTIVGYAKGMVSLASMEEVGVIMTQNFVFTNGPYNGSTLSIVGYNPVFHKYREMAVVGGSGAFRLARGTATAQTVWFNLKSLNAVVEYTVFVLHY